MSIDKIKQGDDLTQSQNLIQTNIVKLKELFPEAMAEGKIDFNVLQELLGNEVEQGEEYYRFTWAGKAQARREAHKPSTGTLRPAKDESVDWDNTQNLYIEGDNLEVLKLVQKSYAGKIKMIYIDPPYNTGNDFVYIDDYSDNLKNYQQKTGQIDSEGNRLTTNSESDGRYHSKWLNMIYPRLQLARNLLKDDGVIFMSIDEVEVNNLRELANEIFGESNFVGQFIWAAGKKNDSKHVSTSHEYIIAYFKNSAVQKEKNINWRIRKKGLDEIYAKYDELKKRSSDLDTISKGLKLWFKSLSDDNPAKRHKHYSSVDEKGIFFPDNISWPGGGGPKYSVFHPVTKKPVKVPSRGWLYGSPERMNEMISENRVVFGVDENSVPCIKAYLSEREYEVPYSVFYLDGRAASKRLRNLMGGDYFDHPKDEILLQEFLEFVDVRDEMVCDFFSGSGTIGESVLRHNAFIKTNTKYILVQIPQSLNDIKAVSAKQKKKQNDTIAFLKSLGVPNNLSELGKERIRRAAKKIAAENPEKAKDLDLGFKVFKLDTSNIKAWDGSTENFEQNLFDAQDNIKPERTEEDVLYEILLKYGLDLTLPIEEKTIAGKKVFSVGYGALFLCLANGVTHDVAEGIGKWKEELNPVTCRVIFKDSGFGTEKTADVEKTNALQTLKRFGIDEVKSI